MCAEIFADTVKMSAATVRQIIETLCETIRPDICQMRHRTLQRASRTISSRMEGFRMLEDTKEAHIELLIRNEESLLL